jgi:hypothetical protein
MGVMAMVVEVTTMLVVMLEQVCGIVLHVLLLEVVDLEGWEAHSLHHLPYRATSSRSTISTLTRY